MANIFKAKTLVSRTGIFSHQAIAPNLVYNTGNQTIAGNKTFSSAIVAPNLVYNTGNETIAGNKTFSSGISTNSLNLNDIDSLSISGLDILIINNIINPSNAEIRINSSGINLIKGDFQLNSSTATNVNSIPLQIAAIQKTAGEANPINITTFSPHGYRAGDTVIVSGLKTPSCQDSLLNGTYRVNEVGSITSFRYYISGNNQTALSTLYAVGCGFPPATVRVSSSKVYLSHLNYSGYNNLLINNPPLILSNKININHSRTIASSASTGLRGDISWDSNYLYVCVEDNTWKRFSGFSW